MNRRQWFVLSIMMLIIFVSGCDNQKLVTNPSGMIDFYSCDDDQDCIMAEIPCCCGSSIKESINQEYEESWTEVKSLEAICNYPCPAGCTATFYYEHTPKCTNNKCDFSKEFKCKEGYQYVLEEGKDRCYWDFLLNLTIIGVCQDWL